MAPERGLTPEDLVHFCWVEDVAITADGQWVAFAVKRATGDLDGYASEVCLIGTTDDPKALRRLPQRSPGRASSLAWSRDDRLLAFVWRTTEAAEVQVWTRDGSQIRRIVLPDAPAELDWHPDGRRLACVRWVRRPDPEAAAAVLPGVPPTVRVIRRLRYKRDGIGFVHDRFQQICVLDIETESLAQMTDDECDYQQPRWSWRGDRLAFIGMAREQDEELGQGQLYICQVAGGSPMRVLPAWRGACRSPQWSPDDQTIAFAGHTEPAPTDRRIFFHVWTCDLRTGETKDLTASLDQTLGNYAVSDQRPGLTNVTLRWPAAGRSIYFLATEQGATHLWQVNADGSGMTRLVDGPGVVFAYAPSTGRRAVYAMATPASINEVYVCDGGMSRAITDLNPWLRSRRLSPHEEYHYRGVDGTPVHAWIVRPVGFVPGRRYPTIVYVHCSMFSWDFNHEVQCYADAGFVVAFFNQRGTTAGYGQAWTRWTEGHQGEQDFEEIMLGVDDLITRPYIDADRLGVTGGSCGGFATNWIVGHTDRFKAAVTQRSIVNWVSKFGTSDIGPEGVIRETGAIPWQRLADVWRQTPLAYVERIRTPLLIVHSDEDHRTPIEQAEQLFAALRWLKRPVEFVWFVGESHGLSTGGRPANRIERIRRIGGWFAKYLGTSAGAQATADEGSSTCESATLKHDPAPKPSGI